MTDSPRSLDHALTSRRSRTTAILASHQLAFSPWGGGMHFCTDVGGGRCGWSSDGPLEDAEQSHRAHVEAALEAAGVGGVVSSNDVRHCPICKTQSMVRHCKDRPTPCGWWHCLNKECDGLFDFAAKHGHVKVYGDPIKRRNVEYLPGGEIA